MGLLWKYESASSANKPSSADTSTENTTLSDLSIMGAIYRTRCNFVKPVRAYFPVSSEGASSRNLFYTKCLPNTWGGAVSAAINDLTEELKLDCRP
jgi:hypothetical protein